MRSLVDIEHFFSNHPLTRNAPLKAWARFVSWQVRSRLKEEVIVPWIAGQRLAVRRGMAGATGNIYVGLQEFEDMMLALHFLAKVTSFSILEQTSAVTPFSLPAFVERPHGRSSPILTRCVALSATS
jgi:hypothetical protein